MEFGSEINDNDDYSSCDENEDDVENIFRLIISMILRVYHK